VQTQCNTHITVSERAERSGQPTQGTERAGKPPKATNTKGGKL